MHRSHHFIRVVTAALIIGASATAAPPDLELVCGTRSPCRIHKSHDAGKTVRGGAITVLEVALHGRTGEDWKEPAIGGKCAPWELWTILRETDGTARSQRLFQLCNDGYGASGVGRDSFKISSNGLRFGQWGGSAWRWSVGGLVQLWPLRSMVATSSNFHTGAGWQDGVQFDFRTFTGYMNWSCDTAGKETRKVPVTPRVTVPEAFATSGWKSTGIGSCAQTVAGNGDGGALVHGPAGSSEDSSMSVVLVDKTFYVEVRDDRLQVGASNWIFEDHIEIWTAKQRPGAFGCQADKPKLEQWGIRLTDGQVFPGYGTPIVAPQVSVAADKDKGIYRLKVTYAEMPLAFAVVFSDSDDGKTQERLIGTSGVKRGEWMSLGLAHDVPPSQATCKTTDEGLVVAPPDAGWRSPFAAGGAE